MKKFKTVLTIQIGFIAGILFAVSCGNDGGFNSIAQNVLSALGVTYDNTTSGLSATNVQDAIDEIVTCPSDMAKTRLGTCIEISPRTAATLITAINTCAGADRHLCNSDWIDACFDQTDGSAIGINGMLPGPGNAEWLFATNYTTNGTIATNDNQCNAASQTEPPSNANKYRCCKNIPN